ncbi:aminotransferase class I/II-fold pyridoxal phosphate-dependent enzyme [Serratia fonticola]|uniref:aminotransferase class I/II-fold pyridoxal phosphate-dependent enzyme n=3 Tax=Serratia fonticola TaxID=47917 RepID=UPI001C48301F|nr:pyridoxal phosphate-dependent aminotransferase family protein [Serratia fonticola]QXN64349.1 pyridoxal phosphate-dependent aminotransferase family protein [Serratia fonticola]
MNDQTFTTEFDVNPRRKLAYANEYLQGIVARHDYLTAQGAMEVIGRVFHGIPGKKTTVSFSSGSLSHQTREMLHLGSYNYSGLNGHPQIIEASIQATRRYGTTSSGVRLLNGTCELHVDMEQRLAKFLGVEEVITFSSGFCANLAVLATLCRKGDVVLSDTLNHQSIVDGLKLSECLVKQYRHASLTSLESKLSQLPLEVRKFIVTDGVFSMDGDFAPLPGIVDLARRYNAFVIVDDAHGTGHVGPNGRGSCAHFQVTDGVDVITGSLSKGLPGVGGFIATSQETAKIIRTAATPYIYSASLPAGVVASIIKAIDILEMSPQLIEQLQSKTAYFTRRLRDAGFNLLNSETSIVPLLTGEEQCCYILTRLLHEQGIYVNPVAHPAVSKSRARIRMNLSSNLSYGELDYSICALIQAGQKLSLI